MKLGAPTHLSKHITKDEEPKEVNRQKRRLNRQSAGAEKFLSWLRIRSVILGAQALRFGGSAAVFAS